MPQRFETDGIPDGAQARTLAGATLELLQATEALAERVVACEEGASLASAFEARDQAFGRLRQRVAAGDVVDVASRARLDRVRTLDQAIMGASRALVESLRGEHRDLLRRRSAIQAHAARERSAPRLVALKA